jgi:transposase-like protein
MFPERSPMRLKGSAKVLEARRRRALALLDQDQDLSLNEVGRKLGCAPSSVLRWRRGSAVTAWPGSRFAPLRGGPQVGERRGPGVESAEHQSQLDRAQVEVRQSMSHEGGVLLL